MKKFLAVLLAVICIFSMATVAFAATNYPANTCKVCGTTFTTDAEFRAHVETACDRVCSWCGGVLSTNEEKAAHEKKCLEGSAHCDYCGKDFTPVADYDDHLEACKAKYFNIPLAKIIATVKDIIAKIDFKKIVDTITGLLGNIGK